MTAGGDVPAVLLGGATNALSVARGLGAIGVHVYALGEGGAPVQHSRYCREFTAIRDSSPQTAMFEWLVQCAPSGAVVIPCEDDGLELILRRRGELAAAGLRPARANDVVGIDLLDKERTYEIARASGVGAPRTVTIRGEEDIARALDEVDMPCALKPLHIHEFAKHFRRKVILVRSESDLRRAVARTSALGLEMLVTEIIQGPEDQYWSYYTYVAGDGTPLVDFTKQKIRQYPVGFGGATYHVTRWNPLVAAAGKRFVNGSGVRGVACVEFKLDPRDGEPKIMECNARVTAANELMRSAGIDLGVMAYQDAAGLPLTRYGGFREGVRLWYPLQDCLAFRHMRRNRQISTSQWLMSLAHRQRFPVFSLDDPAPALHGLRTFPKRAFRLVARSSDQSSDPSAEF